MVAVNKGTPFIKFVFLTIILLPILNIYGCGIPGWSIGSLLCLMLGFIALFKLKIPKDLNIMPKWLYFIFIDAIIVFYLSSNNSFVPLSEIQTFLTFLVVFYYVRTSNIDYFISLYKSAAIICMIMFFLQFVGLHILGIHVSGIFKFLPLAIYNNSASWIADHDSSERLCSFFSEPSHFTYFLMPLICLELCNLKKKWFLVSLLVLTVLLSTAGTGMLALAVVVSVWYLSGLNLKEKGNVPKMILLAFLIATSVGVFLRTNVAAEMLGRTSEMSMEYEGGSRSGFMRLWRGYYVYSEMPIQKKIVGVNNNNMLKKYETSSDFAGTFREDDRYYNGMSMILTRQGLIGFVLFVFLITSLWKRTCRPGHIIIACFICYMLMESVYLNSRMAFYLIFAWCLLGEGKVYNSIK